MRGQEDLLRRVLGLCAVAQERPAEAADEASMVAIELVGQRGGRPMIGRRMTVFSPQVSITDWLRCYGVLIAYATLLSGVAVG